jgi:hypothetical protein
MGSKIILNPRKITRNTKIPSVVGLGRLGIQTLELFTSRHHGALHDFDEFVVVFGEMGGK